MRIGAVAETVGVSAQTIRYYETIGLLEEPGRTTSGYREYDEDVVDRLTFIRDAQATGLTLTEIASVLELKEVGERSCEHTVALLDQHLSELDGQIARLRRARSTLAALAERATHLDPGDCTDPNRCQVIVQGQAEIKRPRDSRLNQGH